jgi:predicted O-methyltransferase YrrM
MDHSTVLLAIETAYDFARENIDLSGCYYGEPHWKGDFVDQPYQYYYFLAGLVAQLRCSRILELGTHFGGSIFAMVRGLEWGGMARTAEVVTVDRKDHNNEAFRVNPLVKRVLANCIAEDTQRQVQALFTGPVDLMFVDTIHNYGHTKTCLDHYCPLVHPSLVVLDDIHLNPSMKKLWETLLASYGDRAIDITEHSRRETEAGFGILFCGREAEGAGRSRVI